MRKNREWTKYDIPQDLEPTKGEKILGFIGDAIGAILLFGIMYIVALFAGAFY